MSLKIDAVLPTAADTELGNAQILIHIWHCGLAVRWFYLSGIVYTYGHSPIVIVPCPLFQAQVPLSTSWLFSRKEQNKCIVIYTFAGPNAKEAVAKSTKRTP